MVPENLPSLSSRLPPLPPTLKEHQRRLTALARRNVQMWDPWHWLQGPRQLGRQPPSRQDGGPSESPTASLLAGSGRHGLSPQGHGV